MCIYLITERESKRQIKMYPSVLELRVIKRRHAFGIQRILGRLSSFQTCWCHVPIKAKERTVSNFRTLYINAKLSSKTYIAFIEFTVFVCNRTHLVSITRRVENSGRMCILVQNHLWRYRLKTPKVCEEGSVPFTGCLMRVYFDTG